MNPNRKAQGGDVEGTTATDVALGLYIDPLSVSKASFDPGYEIGHVMQSQDDGDDFSVAELKQGYASYGRRKVGQS